MKEEVKINIQESDFNEETYNNLKKAIDCLFNNSQESFENIKKEKWYNRIFDMVTFSQKGKKRIADQVSTLAQAQQILCELLTRLSLNNEKISELVLNLTHNSEKIQEQDIYLLSKIKKLENIALGIKPDTDINYLTEKNKQILSGCLHNVCNITPDVSKEQQEFANLILSYINMDATIEKLDEALNNIDDIKSKRKILTCCMEYIYLKNCSYNITTEYEEFINIFDFGKTTINKIWDQISLMYKLRGVDGFYDKYKRANYEEINDLFYIDFPDLDSLENASNLDINDFVICDKNVRDIVDKYKEKIGGAIKEKGRDKKIRKILAELKYKNIADAAVCEIFESGKEKIIFTTYAIYYKNKNCEWCVKYSDIEGISHNQSAVIKTYKNFKISCEKEINCEELIRMLSEIKGLGFYVGTDRVLNIQPFEGDSISAENRIRFFALIYFIITKIANGSSEVFRLLEKYNISQKWNEVKTYIHDDYEYNNTVSELLNSPEIIYSKESLSSALVTELYKTYQYTTGEDFFPAEITYLKEFEEILHGNKNGVFSVGNIALKEKKFMEGKISYNEYKQDISKLISELTTTGLIGILQTLGVNFVRHRYLCVFPIIGQILAVSLSVGAMTIKFVNDNKREGEIFKYSLIYSHAKNYVRAMRTADRYGYMEMSKSLSEKLSRRLEIVLKNTKMKNKMYIPESSEDETSMCSLIRKFITDNSFKEVRLWKNYTEIAKKQIKMEMKKYIDEFNRDNVIGMYDKQILFCRDGFLYIPEKIFVRYVDIETKEEKLNNINIVLRNGVKIQLKGKKFVSNNFKQVLEYIMKVVKQKCNQY